jgi:hypothetical protein
MSDIIGTTYSRVNFTVMKHAKRVNMHASQGAEVLIGPDGFSRFEAVVRQRIDSAVVTGTAVCWSLPFLMAINAELHPSPSFLRDHVARSDWTVANRTRDFGLTIVRFVREEDLFGQAIDLHPGHGLVLIVISSESRDCWALNANFRVARHTF